MKIRLPLLLIIGVSFLYSIIDDSVEFTREDIFPSQNYERMIGGNTNAGPINIGTSEDDLKNVFGKFNVYPSTIKIGDETAECTKVLAGKNDQLDIIWKSANHTTPWKVIVHQNNSWKTDNGIHVGMTISELEKINGKPFSMTVDSENFLLMSKSWKDGKVSSNIVVHFTIQRDKSFDIDSLFKKDQTILSNSEKIDSKIFEINTLIIEIGQ